jgi:hypothetical protein
MTDKPETQQPESSTSISNVSGGVNLDAQHDVNVGGDVVGRDKITDRSIHVGNAASSAIAIGDRYAK